MQHNNAKTGMELDNAVNRNCMTYPIMIDVTCDLLLARISAEPA